MKRPNLEKMRRLDAGIGVFPLQAARNVNTAKNPVPLNLFAAFGVDALKLSIAVAIALEIYRLWTQPQSRYVFDRRTGAIRVR